MRSDFFIHTRLLFCTLILFGCSGGEPRVESGNRDGILHFGNGTEPQTLDPHVSTGKPEDYIQQALFEGLVSLNPYTLEVEPEMAERWDCLLYTSPSPRDS